jgi:hypothetical protein
MLSGPNTLLCLVFFPYHKIRAHVYPIIYKLKCLIINTKHGHERCVLTLNGSAGHLPCCVFTINERKWPVGCEATCNSCVGPRQAVVFGAKIRSKCRIWRLVNCLEMGAHEHGTPMSHRATYLQPLFMRRPVSNMLRMYLCAFSTYIHLWSLYERPFHTFNIIP